MDDVTSKLAEFLNDPDSLDKIKTLSGLLNQETEKNKLQYKKNTAKKMSFLIFPQIQ